MRVTATALGYDGRALRQPGDEFDMPEGSKGSWFVAKEPPAATPPPAPTGRGRKAAPPEAGPAEADLA